MYKRQVFTHVPGRVTVGDSHLCCGCVPCLLSTVNSLRLLILKQTFADVGSALDDVSQSLFFSLLLSETAGRVQGVCVPMATRCQPDL